MRKHRGFLQGLALDRLAGAREGERRPGRERDQQGDGLVSEFDRYWRIRTNLPERYGQPCRINARGKMNSCEIEFEDGVKYIVSRNSIRKRPA